MNDDFARASAIIYFASLGVLFMLMASYWCPTIRVEAIDKAMLVCTPNGGLRSLEVDDMKYVEATCNNDVVITAQYQTGAQR